MVMPPSLLTGEVLSFIHLKSQWKRAYTDASHLWLCFLQDALGLRTVSCPLHRCFSIAEAGPLREKDLTLDSDSREIPQSIPGVSADMPESETASTPKSPQSI